MKVLRERGSAEGEAGHPRTMHAFLCARAGRVASEKRRVGTSERGGVVSTTSSEAGLVGEFLRPFLSYNKDAFCRATLVLAFSFLHHLLLSLSLFLFSSFSSRLASSAIFFLIPFLSLSLPLPFSLLTNVSFYLVPSSSCSSLCLYFALFMCVFLSRAISLLLPHASGSYPCVLFPFSQFCSSSLAHSLSLSSSFPPTLPLLAVVLLPSLSFHSELFSSLSPAPPVARSASIRGIFEPVHDGRLLQGRTFLRRALQNIWNERTDSGEIGSVLFGPQSN